MPHLMQLVPLKEKDENSFQGFSVPAPQENQTSSTCRRIGKELAK